MPDILEDGINWPEELFFFDDRKSKTVSPAARFDPTTAVGGDPWQNSTSPSAIPKKKALIVGKEFLGDFPIDQKLALVARLKDAGFSVYLKQEGGGFYKVQENLDGICECLKHMEVLSPVDAVTMGTQHGVARDKATFLTQEMHETIGNALKKCVGGTIFAPANQLRMEFSLLELPKEEISIDTLHLVSKEVAAQWIRENPSKWRTRNFIMESLFRIFNEESDREIIRFIIAQAFESEDYYDKSDDTKPEGGLNAMACLPGTVHDSLIPELLDEYKDNIANPFLYNYTAGLIVQKLLNTPYSYTIKPLLELWLEKKTLTPEKISMIITKIKGTEYAPYIPLLKKEIDPNYICGIISELKGTNSESLIPGIVEQRISKRKKISEKYYSELYDIVEQYAESPTLQVQIPAIIKKFESHISDYNVTTLIKIVKLLEELNYRDEAKAFLDAHIENVTTKYYYEIIDAVKSLLDSDHHMHIPTFLRKYSFSNVYSLESTILLLNNTSYSYLIPKFVNHCKVQIMKESFLRSNVCSALAETGHTELLHEFMSVKHLAKVIKALNKTPNAHLIPELVARYKKDIPDVMTLVKCVTELAATPYTALIPKLFREYEGPVRTHDFRYFDKIMSSIRGALGPIEFDEKILAPVVRKLKTTLTRSDLNLTLVFILPEIARSSFAHELPEIIAKQKKVLTIVKYPQHLFLAVIALQQSGHHTLIKELIAEYRGERLQGDVLWYIRKTVYSLENKDEVIPLLKKHAGAIYGDDLYGTDIETEMLFSFYNPQIFPRDIPEISSEVTAKPTQLYINELNTKKQLQTLLRSPTDLSHIVALNLGKSHEPRLVSELLRALPRLKYCALPQELQRQVRIPKHVESVTYQDVSVYVLTGKYRPHIGNQAKKNTQIAKEKSSKRTNGVYIGNAEQGKKLNASYFKKAQFTMQEAGELLNGRKAPTHIFRTDIYRYKDITQNLRIKPLRPKTFEEVEVKLLSNKDLDALRTKKDGDYYRFPLSLKAGREYRLISADIQEELVGIQTSNPDAKIRVVRGDDDFFYVTADRKCTLSHVVKVARQNAHTAYNDVPEDHLAKRIFEEYMAKPDFKGKMPQYRRSHHKEWLAQVYDTKAGECRHKVAGIYDRMIEQGVDSNEIRCVNIDGTHVRLELNYEGQWISFPDQGGDKRQEITHIYDKEHRFNIQPSKYNIRGMLRKKAPVIGLVTGTVLTGGLLLAGAGSVLAIKKLKHKHEERKQRPPEEETEITKQKKQTRKIRKTLEDSSEEPKKKAATSSLSTSTSASGLAELRKPILVNNEELLINETVSGTKKRTLLVTGSALDAHANRLIAEAKKAGRPVYYIDSPAKIDLNHDTVILEDKDHASIHEHGMFERFLHTEATEYRKPLLLINWDAFSPKEQVQLNTLISKKPTVHGEPLPSPLQTISLCKTKPTDSSFLSRHHAVVISSVALAPADEKKTGAPEIIDLKGLPDWKTTLFGRVVLRDNEMHWKQSAFAKTLLSGEKKAFELCNLSGEAVEAFDYMYRQAKAFGEFTYHGFTLPIPDDLVITVNSKSFDFSKFAAHPLRKNQTVERVPQNAVLVNTHLFDHLLHQKEIEQGKYNETKGRIAEAHDGRLPLFITSTLSDNQWYYLLRQAEKHHVSLDLYLAPDVPSPHNLKAYSGQLPKVKHPHNTASLPRLYVSNDPDQLARELANKDTYAILSSEDYGYQDLVGNIDFTMHDGHFSDFTRTESELISALRDEKSIILKGEFPPDLLSTLQPLLLDTVIGSRLTCIIEDTAITAASKNYQPLGWLPADAYQVAYRTPREVVAAPEYHEIPPSHIVDLSNSVKEAEQFITQRKAQFLSMLEDNALLEMVGSSGVGKSQLLKMLKKDGMYVYRELDQLERFAQDKRPERKILFIDESNIDDRHFTMFSPLKASENRPGEKRRILYKGKLHELEPEDRIVFAHNPKEYGGGRVEQKLFAKGDIPSMHLADFPAAYIYEYILKRAIYDRLADRVKSTFPEKDFKETCTRLIRDYYARNAEKPETITVRELQEQTLSAIVDHMPQRDIPKLKSKNFIETTATKKAITTLDHAITISQYQREGLFPHEAVGINGVLLEGEPGVGKTEMIRAMLEAKGILPIGDPNKAKQHYYKMDASMPFEKKCEMIIETFERGYILWIDEINACMDDGTEKFLNAVLTGIHPVTGEKAKVPGFKVLASMNPISLAGRSSISPAVMHRMHYETVPALSSYKLEDWITIVGHWQQEKHPHNLMNPKATKKIAKHLIEQVAIPDTDGNIHNLRSLKKLLPDLEALVAKTTPLTKNIIAPVEIGKPESISNTKDASRQKDLFNTKFYGKNLFASSREITRIKNKEYLHSLFNKQETDINKLLKKSKNKTFVLGHQSTEKGITTYIWYHPDLLPEEGKDTPHIIYRVNDSTGTIDVERHGKFSGNILICSKPNLSQNIGAQVMKIDQEKCDVKGDARGMFRFSTPEKNTECFSR